LGNLDEKDTVNFGKENLLSRPLESAADGTEKQSSLLSMQGEEEEDVENITKELDDDGEDEIDFDKLERLAHHQDDDKENEQANLSQNNDKGDNGDDNFHVSQNNDKRDNGDDKVHVSQNNKKVDNGDDKVHESQNNDKRDIKKDDTSGKKPLSIMKENKQVAHSVQEPIIGLVVFTFNRKDYLEQTLNRLLQVRDDTLGGKEQFPIVVSQDGNNINVRQLLSTYEDQGQINVIKHEQPHVPTEQKHAPGYYHISQHYKFGLQKMFEEFNYDQIILLEDDLSVAPDFFTYFKTLLPVLKNDSNLLCVSAWNDNGLESLVNDPKALRRTDVFPGLGWMMTREIYNELIPKWPETYWDDFLRLPENRKDRQCIYPEINRVKTFGEVGTSSGQFFRTYLQKIKLNDVKVDWPQQQERIDIVSTSKNYSNYLQTLLDEAETVKANSIAGENKIFHIDYDNNNYNSLCKKLHIMCDEKAGLRRTSFNGKMIIKLGTNTIILTKTD